MADYTPSSGSIMQPYRSPWGAFPIRHFAENNGSTFKLGQLVMQSTQASTAAHRVEEMSTLSTAIVGVAAQDATGTVDTKIPVWEANPSVEFKGVAKGTLASSNVGSAYAFAYDSTKAIYYVDLATATVGSVRCIVTEIVSPSAVGDSNGYVAFKFLTEDMGEASTRGHCLAYFK